MFFYLAEGKTIGDLEKFGFRDAGDFYSWGAVKETSTEEVACQDVIIISKYSKKVTTISYGKGFTPDNMKARLKVLYDYGLIKYLTLAGAEKRPNFSGV